MFGCFAVKLFAIVMLIYFIIDLITTLVGKYMEQKAEKNSEKARKYIDDNYAIDLDNTSSIDISKTVVGIPEIPSNMSKKVSKEKKKMG